MTKEQAINLLDQVCLLFKGTRQEHMLLQQAMELVKSLEEPLVKKQKTTAQSSSENVS